MKATLITLPILGFLSTPTVATFIVGTWTHTDYSTPKNDTLATGTFISTAIPGQDKKQTLTEGQFCDLKAQDPANRPNIEWLPRSFSLLDAPDYYNLPIPHCPSVRIQKTERNLYGQLVDPAHPDQDFGTCYKVPDITEKNNVQPKDKNIQETCPDGKDRKVFYKAQIICLSKCGGSYDEDYKLVPGKPMSSTFKAIAPRATATFSA